MLRRARKRRATNDSSSDTDDEDSLVQRCGASVYFHSDVTKKSVMRLLKLLNEAAEVALPRSEVPSEAKIVLFIHSYGGDVYAGLSAMDHISNFRVPVWTCVDGYVASAATFILLGGKRRFGMPSSRLLVHQLSTGFYGKYKDLVDEATNSKALMTLFSKIYTSRTCLTAKQVEKMLSSEKDISFQTSVSHGFVEGAWPPVSNNHIRWDG